MSQSDVDFLLRKVGPKYANKFQGLDFGQQTMVLEALQKHRICCEKTDVFVQKEAIFEMIDMAEKQERAYDSGSLVDMPLPSRIDTSIGVMNRTALGTARSKRANSIKAQMSRFSGAGLSFMKERMAS